MKGLTGTAVLALAAATAVLGWDASPVSADTTGASIVYKTGTDASTGSTATSPGTPGSPAGSRGTAHPGDTVSWAISYGNQTPVAATASITDVLTSAGAYVPGSLVVPPNPDPTKPYSTQYSTNAGGTWTQGTPPANANGVGLVGTFPSAVGTIQQASPAFPAAAGLSFNNTSGDGYNAVSYDGKEVYAVFHHLTGTPVFCMTLAQQACPGWPGTNSYVSRQAGDPIGTGTNDTATAWQNGTFIVGTHMYWLAETTGAIGGLWRMGTMCLDVVSLTSCGFTQLDTSTFGPGSTAGINGTGIAASNGKYYFATTSGNLVCFDAAAQAACGSTLMTGPRSGAITTDPTFGDYTFPMTYTATGLVLGCYNVATSTACPGFPKAGMPTGNAGGLYPDVEAAPVLDPAGTLIGVCALRANAAIPGCWNLSGAAINNPYPSTTGVLELAGDVLALGSRVYVQDQDQNQVACLDFSLYNGTGTAPRCAGYTNAANPSNYSSRQFAGTNCMLADGDGRRINVYDATLGQSTQSCASSTLTSTVKPSLFYCQDGAAGLHSWSQLVLTGLTPSAYGAAVVSIRDANNQPVPGFQSVTLPSGTTTLDISSIPVSGATSSLNATVTLTSVSDAAGITGAQVALRWNGAQAQVCFKTVAPTVACGESSTISNNALAVTSGTGGSDAPGGNASGATVFDVVPSPDQCSLDVKKTSSVGHTGLGDTVTYTITATNTGTMPYSAADPARWTDDLSGVLANAAYNGDASASAGAVSYAAPVLSWQGPLAAGASATVTYSVRVGSSNNGNDLTNSVRSDVIGSSCTDSSPATSCTAVVPVYGLTIVKKAAEPYFSAVGEIIHYTFLVTNVGSATVSSLSVADTPVAPAGALDAPPVCPVTTLAAGASTTCTGQYSVTAADSAQGSVADTAVAEGVSPAGDPITSPPSAAAVPVRMYTVAKTVSTTSAVPGQTVTYTVVVHNPSQVDYTASDPASFSDDVTGVLDDAVYNDDATGGATLSGSTLAWSGPLGAGETATITYSVTVASPDVGDHVLRNAVSASGAGGSCDPDATCTTSTPVQTYRVVKTSTATTVGPGTVIPYTVTVTNTGDTAYTAQKPATVSDDLADVLDDAVYNQDATSSTGDGVGYSGGVLTWSGPLETGATVTIAYSVTIDSPDPGDHLLENTATPASEGGTCADTGCTTRIPIASYAVRKTASLATAAPGDVVHYTITVSNTGPVGYTASSPARVDDDLTDVLGGADYNGDARSSSGGGVSYSEPVLSWAGALPAAATVVITYSATIRAGASGAIRNTVSTPAGAGANCATNDPLITAADNPCTVETRIATGAPPGGVVAPPGTAPVAATTSAFVSGPLADTGTDVTATLIAAIAAASAGLLLVLLRRRRRPQR